MLKYTKASSEEAIKLIIEEQPEMFFEHAKEVKTHMFGADLQLDPEAYEKMIYDGSYHFYLVKEEDELIGYLGLTKDNDYAQSDALYVLPEYRGQGVFKKLMALAESDLYHNHGAKGIVLYQSAERDISEVLKKLGYHKTIEVKVKRI